jgi:ankyrin repeat protein
MSHPLTLEQKQQLQDRYRHLTNYLDDDPLSPIDPESYVDSNGDHLIHIAASAGDAEAIALLLSAGADVNQLGDMGNTALHYARANGHEAVSRLLLEHGASEIAINEFGKTP